MLRWSGSHLTGVLQRRHKAGRFGSRVDSLLQPGRAGVIVLCERFTGQFRNWPGCYPAFAAT